MDDLTRERYPFDLPVREMRARPQPRQATTEAEAMQRRIILCGTADLAVISRGVHTGREKEHRLRNAIRAASPPQHGTARRAS